MNTVHHRIWFGSFLTNDYRLNLLRFKARNPRYEIHLWTDFSTISIEEKQQFEDFCGKHNFKLHSIREHQDLLNIDLILEELDKALLSPEKKRIHYVRASDLARAPIVYEYGGLYLDTDTNSVAPLPELSSPNNVLLKRLDLFSLLELAYNLDEPTKFGTVFIDFIAAEPRNPFLKFVTEIARLDYNTYHNSHNLLWETSSSANIHLFATVRLTGSAIRFALNHEVAHGNLRAKIMEENDLFFNDKGFLDSTYDKSWLVGLSRDETDSPEELASMEAFRKEIDTVRDKHYPHNLPSLRANPRFSFKREPREFRFKPDSFHFDAASVFRRREEDRLNPQDTLAAAANYVSFRPQEVPFEIKVPKFDLRTFNLPIFNIEGLAVDFQFNQRCIELLTGYLNTIPRQGFTKLFSKPAFFNTVKSLVDKLKGLSVMNPQEIVTSLNQIIETVPENQRTRLRDIVETLKPLVKPERSLEADTAACST